MAAAAASLGIVVLVLTIGTQGRPEEGAANGVGPEILGQVEVRGQRSILSDGRTARNVTAASGLTTPRGPSSVTAHAPEHTDVADPATELRLGDGASPLEGWQFPATALLSAGSQPTAPPLRPGHTAALSDASSVSDPSLRARGQQALESISYPWRTRIPNWAVSFRPARDGMRGLTFSDEQRIEIYIRHGDTTHDIARVLVHELGHAVDLTLNDTGDRRRWLAARGIAAGVPWWPESGRSDFATGAGDFAECFATLHVGSASLSQVGGPCSPADLDVVATLS